MPIRFQSGAGESGGNNWRVPPAQCQAIPHILNQCPLFHPNWLRGYIAAQAPWDMQTGFGEGQWIAGVTVCVSFRLSAFTD